MARLDFTPRELRPIVRATETNDYEPYVTQGSLSSEAHPHGWWLFRASGAEDAERCAKIARAKGLEEARAYFLGHWLVLLRPVSREDIQAQEAARARQRARDRARAEAEVED